MTTNNYTTGAYVDVCVDVCPHCGQSLKKDIKYVYGNACGAEIATGADCTTFNYTYNIGDEYNDSQ